MRRSRGVCIRIIVLLLLAAGCGREEPAPPAPAAGTWAAARELMVQRHVLGSGVRDERVLEAMRTVPLHEFVPEAVRGRAYSGRRLDIGHGQAVSRPHLVAIMAELADLEPGEKVLEIGTGSGYGAAVLARVAGEVYTIEIIEPLARGAERTLQRLGYENVFVRSGDGYRGWPEAAPFDAVIVTAAPPTVPEPLREQLAVGGRLVIPVGQRSQEMRVITRTPEGFREEPLFPVRIVPMTGEAQETR